MTSVCLYLGSVLLCTLGSSLIFKMSVKNFENSAKNISENILKIKLEENIKFPPYNHLVYICAEETNF